MKCVKSAILLLKARKVKLLLYYPNINQMADNDENVAAELQAEELANAAMEANMMEEDPAQAAIRRQRELAARHGQLVG